MLARGAAENWDGRDLDMRAVVWTLVLWFVLAGCAQEDGDPGEAVQPIDYVAIEARLEPRRPRGKTTDRFPNIALTDQHGREYRFFDDLIENRAVIINFMFTECALVCPGTTSHLVRLHSEFGAAVGRDVMFLSVTLDPGTDSQEVLHRYWEAFGSHEGWLYLRGDYEEVELLRRRMGVYDLDPIIDADKTQHGGILTFGNDATDRWAALPALSSLHDLKDTIIRFALLGNARRAARERSGPDGQLEDSPEVYRVRGIVRSVDELRRMILLEHQDIPGLMPAMTMTFSVSSEVGLSGLSKGQEVEVGIINESEGFRIVEMTETGSSPPAAIPGGGAVEAAGRDYVLYCAACHGERGGGDGPLAATLDPRPAKHSDAEYMNALSDDYLFRVIAQGGAAVGKSPLMAGWGGTLSSDQIQGLVAFVRSLADSADSETPEGVAE